MSAGMYIELFDSNTSRAIPGSQDKIYDFIGTSLKTIQF